MNVSKIGGSQISGSGSISFGGKGKVPVGKWVNGTYRFNPKVEAECRAMLNATHERLFEPGVTKNTLDAIETLKGKLLPANVEKYGDEFGSLMVRTLGNFGDQCDSAINQIGAKGTAVVFDELAQLPVNVSAKATNRIVRDFIAWGGTSEAKQQAVLDGVARIADNAKKSGDQIAMRALGELRKFHKGYKHKIGFDKEILSILKPFKRVL